MNLNEVVNYTDKADEATTWAMFHEFTLRQQRWEVIRMELEPGSVRFIGDTRRFNAP